MSMSGQGTESTDGVHPLTRLSSQGDYVVVDHQAGPVLRATRIEQPRPRLNGLLYEFCHAVKSSLLSARPSAERPFPPTTLAAATAQCPNTSGWDDAGERSDDYIDAKHAAEAVNYKNYA